MRSQFYAKHVGNAHRNGHYRINIHQLVRCLRRRRIFCYDGARGKFELPRHFCNKYLRSYTQRGHQRFNQPFSGADDQSRRDCGLHGNTRSQLCGHCRRHLHRHSGWYHLHDQPDCRSLHGGSHVYAIVCTNRGLHGYRVRTQHRRRK